jgi:hypothetical protein
MSPKDIIIEDGDTRWRVVQVSTTQKLRVKVHQVLQISRVNQNDIEYNIPIIGAE